MTKFIYSVYDSVAEELFGPLVVLPNDAVARRFFQDAVLGEGSNMKSHAGDYSLLCLGSIDTGTGELLSSVRAVMDGQTIIDLQEKVNHGS